jgi:hypothetical protein
MHAGQLLDCVIRPTLDYMADASGLPLNTDAAAFLLLGTAAAESKLGKYLKQYPAGPAVGIYQIEPRTFEDMMVWVNLSDQRSAALKPFLSIKPYPHVRQLIGNLFLATAASRLYYWRITSPLPQSDDLPGMAQYWKRYYNTEAGKGTPEKFIQAWLECGLEAVCA